MEKSKVIIIILAVLLIAVGIYLVINMIKIKQLNEDNNNLNNQIINLTENNKQINDKVKSLEDSNSLLMRDVQQIYKSCITQNACKGHFPGIRWSCNNVGDAVTGDMASHICVCDSSCNLNATQVKTI